MITTAASHRFARVQREILMSGGGIKIDYADIVVRPFFEKVLPEYEEAHE